jgi:xanthine/CO dehydrogenase XdhC/CoxF family maturation factor
MRAIAQSNTAETVELQATKIFIAPIDLPARLLVLGAGADAAPVVELAALLGWQVTIADHRPAYAVAERFARAKQVVLSPAPELSKCIMFDEFDAAVVMSHHLLTDQIYLAALADTQVRYVGLLGPANRRKRLLAEIGDRADKLANRLAGPVGLDIGAHTPETIALAIVAEIHAHLEGRTGSSFSGLLRSA